MLGNFHSVLERISISANQYYRWRDIGFPSLRQMDVRVSFYFQIVMHGFDILQDESWPSA
jgi:hypothetical protein